MPTTYILRDTNSDLGGGADFSKQLLKQTATGSTLQVTVAPSATELSYGFTEPDDPSTAGVTGNYTVEVNVTSGSTDIQLSIQLRRIDSAGAVQSSSPISSEQTGSAGVKTFSLTDVNLGTWQAGDRLRVDYRFRNTNTHSNRSVTIQFNTTDCEVVAPWAAAFALTADPGNYSLSGASATIIAGRVTGADPSSYAAVGASAPLLVDYAVVSEAGAYSAVGSVAEAVGDVALSANPDSYAVSGAASDPLVERQVGAVPGTYQTNGAAALLPADGLGLLVEPGAYALSGIGAGLIIDALVLADPESYWLTGIAAELLAGRILLDDLGSYLIVGLDAELVHGVPPLGAFDLVADPGAYSLIGILSSGALALEAAAGVYADAGVDAGVVAVLLISAESGAYGLAGQAAAIVANRVVSAQSIGYALTGALAELLAQRKLDGSPGGYGFIGISAGLVDSQTGLFMIRRIASARPTQTISRARDIARVAPVVETERVATAK